MHKHSSTSRSQATHFSISLLPRTAADGFRMGQALQKHGKNEEAAVCYQRSLALDPSDLQLWNRIGGAFKELGLPQHAVFCYRHIVDRVPNIAEASACLGSALREMGSYEEAAACFRRALKLQPENASFHNSLGVVLRELDLIDEAVAHYRRALLLQPENANARWNLALVQLLEGDFAEGWGNYEARWQRDNAPCNFPQPLWRGQPLGGARILLHAEQGLGDNIQFLRFVPQVEALGGKVILALPPSQHTLAAQLAGLSSITFATTPPQPFDWHCPLMSLPMALGITLDTIPARVPYLSVPDQARTRAASLPWPARGLRIGLAWSGNPEHPYNRFRSIPLARFQPLLQLGGAHFFSLQMGKAAAQLEPWRRRIADLAPATHDMADTAAQMEQLDLVITVDTLAAHLAGALGFPVWLLLPFAADWRWMRHRYDSPWYPTMRIFRQSEPGNWQPVIDRLRSELAALTEKGFPPMREELVHSARLWPVAS
jgi:Tfp pilus assembly protein PilF